MFYVLKSKQGTIIIVYKFWNQFGNIERCSTLNKLLQTHKIKQSGTTSINCEKINTNKLNANLSGVSQTNFNLKGNDIEKLKLDLSGVSSFSLKNTYKSSDINTSGISKFNK